MIGAAMQPYANRGGNSSVSGFEIGPHYIIVQFKDGWKYEYTHQSAGVDHVSKMHRLAMAGKGLNSFITDFVRQRYSRKWK